MYISRETQGSIVKELKEGYFGISGVECITTYSEGDIPVVFLHGFRFTRNVWLEIGALQKTSELGYKVIAPDMPYGIRTDCSKHTRNIDLNVEIIRALLRQYCREEQPVIVGASLGGRIALHYALRFPVRGLLLLSPAIKNEDPAWKIARRLNLPVIIARGAKDFIPRNILQKLAKKLGGEYVEYPESGHTFYMSLKEKFLEDLETFLNKVINE